MPISEITYQNKPEAIISAYRPITYRCKANNPYQAVNQGSQPKSVFCDIYIDGIYYKSLWKSQPIDDDGIEYEYEFDIQDSLQEVLGYNLPSVGNMNVLEFTNTIRNVYVKFRNTYLVEGFIHSEQQEPVQGTTTIEPIEGGGMKSDAIYVTNILIQHEDKLSVEDYLNDFKTGSWKQNAYPLTRRPKLYKLCKDDSSFFPIISSDNPAYIVGNFTVQNKIFSIEAFFNEICPLIENVNYSSKLINGQRKKVILSWNKIKKIDIVGKIIIYYRELYDDDWMIKVVDPNATQTSFNVNNVSHDFKFQTTGSCLVNPDESLPFISNKITSKVDDSILENQIKHESLYPKVDEDNDVVIPPTPPIDETLDPNSAKITNKTHLVSECESAGQKIMFNIEGNPDQIVNFKIEIIENSGVGFQFNINNADENIFSSITNTTLEGTFYLNEFGINEYYATLCLNPCLTQDEISVSMIKLTLFNMDNTKPPTQSIIFAASQNC